MIGSVFNQSRKEVLTMRDELIASGCRFVNPDEAFIKCLDTDEERMQYMYMYSKGDTHYFKHIDTREYKTVELKGLVSRNAIQDD